MSIMGDIEATAVGGIWKLAAIGLMLGMLTSSAYLGYEWHLAAGARDTAVTERHNAEFERDKALADNGELKGAIAGQNASILKLSTESAIVRAQYDTAMTLLTPIKQRIQALADKIAAMPHSVTCDQSLAKQRKAIEGLHQVQP